MAKFLSEHVKDLETRFVHGREIDASSSSDSDDDEKSRLSARFVHGRSIQDNSELEQSNEDSSIEENSSESDEK